MFELLQNERPYFVDIALELFKAKKNLDRIFRKNFTAIFDEILEAIQMRFLGRKNEQLTEFFMLQIYFLEYSF